MMPTAMSTTTPATAIGPQLRPPLTLTGVIGLRPLPPPLPPLGCGPLPAGREPPALAGGLPCPEVLSTFTVDGTRSGPGVLILIVPRQFVRMVGPGPRAGPGTPPGAKVYPDSMAQ